MDKPPAAQTFNLLRLPPELRDRIWFFRLPRRVVPLDDYLFDQDEQIEQQCWSKHISLQAKAPSLIASVCREARYVALRWGGVEELNHGVSLYQVWTQRQLDAVLCAWTPDHSALAGHDVDMLDQFLLGQRLCHPGAPVCLLAEHFYPFYSNPSAPENRDRGNQSGHMSA